LKKQKFNLRINNEIRSPELRVIGEDGKQLGVMTTVEALKKAEDQGVDLIEIAPLAKPPVAKIIELGKYRYQEEKKLKKEKKSSKPSELKEIRFSPFIAENDFNTRIERVKEFLDNKHKVRIVVVFMGRQMGSKPVGYELLRKINNIFKDRTVIDMEPKFIGRHLAMVISPVNKIRRPEEQENRSQTIKNEKQS
jgi:translation initiation factor IF-3